MDSNDVNNIDGLEEENSISEGEENEEDKDELVEDDEVLEEKSDFVCTCHPLIFTRKSLLKTILSEFFIFFSCTLYSNKLHD